MNLFKENKTNWKYILIVVILAAIVGGAILCYSWWMAKEEMKLPEAKTPKEIIKQPSKGEIPKKNIDIIIATDKTEYEIFEEPMALISNNSTKTINIFFQPEHLFRVEGYMGGEWKNVPSYVSNIPASRINYGNEESSYLQSMIVESGMNVKFNFCFCSNVNLKGSGIKFRVEKDEPFKPGKYRLIVPYTFEGSDVIEYVYSNEFVVKDYKFNDAEFFCKYKYSSLAYTKSGSYVNTKEIVLAAGPREGYRTSVYYSSFLNFDQDKEKELLVVCGDPIEGSYLYVLDKQDDEYKKELLYRVMSGQRHQFSDLSVVDIDKDGLDEIFFKESTWYMVAGNTYFIIYSPKYGKEIVAASIKSCCGGGCGFNYEESEKCEDSGYVGLDEVEFKDFLFNNSVFAQPFWYMDNGKIKSYELLVRSVKKRVFSGQPPLSQKEIIEEEDIQWLISNGAVYEYNKGNNNFFMIYPAGANAILKKDDTFYIGLFGLYSGVVYYNVKTYEMREFTKSDFPGVKNKMEIIGDELIIDGYYKIPLNEFVF